MNHFFVTSSQIVGDTALIVGEDVNHIKNVLRMKPGEELSVSDESGSEFLCRITQIEEEGVSLQIIGRAEGRELPVEIVLYQGLPKGDKMETIIQKCVELGVSRIVPVAQSRCVMKLDAKKAASKRERWQKIAESAAKQSKRGVIPVVSDVMSFAQALEDAALGDAMTHSSQESLRHAHTLCDTARDDSNIISLIAYEDKNGMAELKAAFDRIGDYMACFAASKAIDTQPPHTKAMRINIFIGPEGGYDPSEVEAATDAGAAVVSLGKRILRTETAGMALIAAIMLQVEMYAG